MTAGEPTPCSSCRKVCVAICESCAASGLVEDLVFALLYEKAAAFLTHGDRIQPTFGRVFRLPRLTQI
jgi:hypothetical protein